MSYCPTNNVKTNLGQAELEKLKTYLIQNPLPDKGRNYIAKYHGFIKEWNDVKKKHDDTTSVSDKMFVVLLVCTLKRDPRMECISH